MTNKKNWLGIFAVAILFLVETVVFAGGAAENETDNNNSELMVNGVQLYRFDGSVYPGNGEVQMIEGQVNMSFGGDGTSIGYIGFISPDGRLTIALPPFITDSQLVSAGTNNRHDRVGVLAIGVCLVSFPGMRDHFRFEYANGNFTSGGRPLKRGWNVIDTDRNVVVDINTLRSNNFVWRINWYDWYNER